MVQEELITKRYNITATPVSHGGPGGYESTYLAHEGDKAPASLETLFADVHPTIAHGQLRGRNIDSFIDNTRKLKRTGIVSGFKPSGAYHFGHRLTAQLVGYFQKNGQPAFMPVADLECLLDTNLSRADSGLWASDNLLDWGSSGVNLDAAHVYLQSEEFRVSTISYLVARGLSLDLALDTYGFTKLRDGFPFLFAGMTQVGDILLPQHDDFYCNGSQMVSGQDQDGHMNMTLALTERALASGANLKGIHAQPSSIYVPHVRGFLPKEVGEAPKMSSSFPAGTLYLGSGPQQLDVNGRIRATLEKIDFADKHHKKHLERCALDLLLNLEDFQQYHQIPFKRAMTNSNYTTIAADFENAVGKEAVSRTKEAVDSYLLGVAVDSGYDVIGVLKTALPEILLSHNDKRAQILSYAIARDKGHYPQPPEFWGGPQQSAISEKLRNDTPWYSIVAKNAHRVKA